jgi:hypothetical protein
VLLVMPERMSVASLYRYIRHLKDNQVKTQRYEIAMWKKLVYPLAALVMMALALPFAYLQDRMGAVSVKVFAGIMLGITFHMLNGLFSNLGAINSWPPFFSAMTPSATIPAGGSRDVVVVRTPLTHSCSLTRRVPASRSCRNCRSRSANAQRRPMPPSSRLGQARR